jgi:hypothetical protein
MELTAASPSVFGTGPAKLALLVLRRRQLIWSVGPDYRHHVVSLLADFLRQLLVVSAVGFPLFCGHWFSVLYEAPYASPAQQIGAGNSRRAFPFPGFCGLHTFFLSSTPVPGGCA